MTFYPYYGPGLIIYVWQLYVGVGMDSRPAPTALRVCPGQCPALSTLTAGFNRWIQPFYPRSQYLPVIALCREATGGATQISPALRVGQQR